MNKKAAAVPKPVTVDLGQPQTDLLKNYAGSESGNFNNVLLKAVAGTIWTPANRSEEDRQPHFAAALTANGRIQARRRN